MPIIAHLPAPEQPDVTTIRDQIAICDRVRPHLRDLGDLAALDARRTNLLADLQRLGGAA